MNFKEIIRLLTEYHSFVCLMKRLKIVTKLGSFRLLTEYHLFLYKNFEEMAQKTVVKFPSPCGVSFILIV